MADPETLSDEELVRRLAGHLKGPLEAHLPKATPPQVRIFLGIWWFILFLGGMGILWAVVGYPILYVLTGIIMDILRFFDPFGSYFTRESLRTNGVMNNLVFTILAAGSYLIAVAWLIRRAAQNRPTEDDEEIYHIRADSVFRLRNFWILAQFVLTVLTFLPAWGIQCLGIGRKSREPSAMTDQTKLVWYARLALVIARSPEPLGMEKTWRLLQERFPGSGFQGEEKDKALLLGSLRDLAEVKLIQEVRHDIDRVSDRTLYRPTEKLQALIDRCRNAGRDAPDRLDSESPASPTAPRVSPDDDNRPPPRRILPPPPPDLV